MTVRDSAQLFLSGTAFQAVVGDDSGLAPGEMWENQRAEPGISSKQTRTVVHLSKLGFPRSHPSLEINSPVHGLEAHATKRRGIAHGYLDRLKTREVLMSLIGLRLDSIPFQIFGGCQVCDGACGMFIEARVGVARQAIADLQYREHPTHID